MLVIFVSKIKDFKLIRIVYLNKFVFLVIKILSGSIKEWFLRSCLKIYIFIKGIVNVWFLGIRIFGKILNWILNC